MSAISDMSLLCSLANRAKIKLLLYCCIHFT